MSGERMIVLTPGGASPAPTRAEGSIAFGGSSVNSAGRGGRARTLTVRRLLYCGDGCG
jgi:hypothetical protein